MDFFWITLVLVIGAIVAISYSKWKPGRPH